MSSYWLPPLKVNEQNGCCAIFRQYLSGSPTRDVQIYHLHGRSNGLQDVYASVKVMPRDRVMYSNTNKHSSSTLRYHAYQTDLFIRTIIKYEFFKSTNSFEPLSPFVGLSQTCPLHVLNSATLFDKRLNESTSNSFLNWASQNNAMTSNNLSHHQK